MRCNSIVHVLAVRVLRSRSERMPAVTSEVCGLVAPPLAAQEELLQYMQTLGKVGQLVCLQTHVPRNSVSKRSWLQWVRCSD